MSKSANSIWALLLIAVVAVALGWFAQQWQGAPTPLVKAILLPQAKALPLTQFTDHTDTPFSSSEFSGQWQILFFGFTHCPDICPSTLYTLKQVKETLVASSEWRDIQVNMVSVDPERDTPQRLAQYVPFFDPSFRGLTADTEALTKFAKSVGVLFLAHAADERGNYDVDHSAALVLLNPEGNYAGVISAPHNKDEIAHDLAIITSEYESKPQTEKRIESGDATPNALELSNAWIRPAPPNSDALAAYFTANNVSDDEIVITGASSPMFEEIMIHTTVSEQGLLRMQHLDKLVVAPQGETKLEPTKTHLMLMDPISEIAVGDLVPITLSLADESSIQAIFEVKVPSSQ